MLVLICSEKKINNRKEIKNCHLRAKSQNATKNKFKTIVSGKINVVSARIEIFSGLILEASTVTISKAATAKFASNMVPFTNIRPNISNLYFQILTSYLLLLTSYFLPLTSIYYSQTTVFFHLPKGFRSPKPLFYPKCGRFLSCDSLCVGYTRHPTFCSPNS